MPACEFPVLLRLDHTGGSLERFTDEGWAEVDSDSSWRPRSSQSEAAGFKHSVEWAQSEHRLRAVSDRIGLSPLYHTSTSGNTYLSDSASALTAIEAVRTKPDIRAFVRFIHGVPPQPGGSFFDSVHVVRPGHVLQCEGPTIREFSYWELEPHPGLRLENGRAYDEACVSRLSDVITDYLPRQRFGVTMSGGLDSTTVAAMARTVRPPDDIVAFTWVAPEVPEADERAIAAAAADHLGIRLVPIRADEHWPLSSPEGLVTTRETPFVNFYHELWAETFAAMRREGVTIAVSGLDGDRLFGGGIFPHADLFLTGRWPTLVKGIREHLGHVTMSLPQLVRQTVLAPIAHAYFPPVRSGPDPVPWLKDDQHELLRYEDKGSIWTGLPARYMRLRVITDPFVAMTGASAIDHAGNHDIEFRHPLLDHRLLEFASRLPQRVVTEGFTQKAIVRRAMSSLLPVEVTGLFDKIRPTAIGYLGLREREQRKVWPLMHDMRLSDLGIVDERVLRDHYQAFIEGRGDTMFWYTISLEDWLRRHW